MENQAKFESDETLLAPGNPGIESLAKLVPLKAMDLSGLADFAEAKRIDLTVVGPEQPLAAGIVDMFEERGLRIFGPTKRAAELEWSKTFAKEFMRRHSVPTAHYRTFNLHQFEEATEKRRLCLQYAMERISLHLRRRRITSECLKGIVEKTLEVWVLTHLLP